MTISSSIAIRIVLVAAGAFIAFTGIDKALGGIETLGWQGVASFMDVTDEHAFLVQDSHARFLGGLWAGVGLLFLVAATNLHKYRRPLNFACTFIFLGGLARLSQMNFDILFGPDILGSLLAELVGMPLLYFWLARITAGTHETGHGTAS